jgi:D-sedoheptulose 7-phosphate isomerase
MNREIIDRIGESIEVKAKIMEDMALVSSISDVVELCIYAIEADKKIWFCGNGGSAADAQHLASEFSGRFYHDRDPYFAEALHCNTSYLTAVANDYSFDQVYSRLIKAKGRAGDIFFGLSTSGNSKNVVEAFKQAELQDLVTIGMTGATGGQLIEYADICLCMPSNDTPRIQEAHMLVGHIICEFVERELMR